MINESCKLKVRGAITSELYIVFAALWNSVVGWRHHSGCDGLKRGVTPLLTRCPMPFACEPPRPSPTVRAAPLCCRFHLVRVPTSSVSQNGVSCMRGGHGIVAVVDALMHCSTCMAAGNRDRDSGPGVTRPRDPARRRRYGRRRTPYTTQLKQRRPILASHRSHSSSASSATPHRSPETACWSPVDPSIGHTISIERPIGYWASMHNGASSWTPAEPGS